MNQVAPEVILQEMVSRYYEIMTLIDEFVISAGNNSFTENQVKHSARTAAEEWTETDEGLLVIVWYYYRAQNLTFTSTLVGDTRYRLKRRF